MSNKVFDIRQTAPTKDDVFFVDTNIWYWMTYASSKTFPDTKVAPQEYQTTHYPDFIQKALTAESQLYYSPLSLAELANTIESIELNLFKIFNPDNDGITRKAFRNIRNERNAVVQEVDAAWATITTLSKVLKSELTEELSENSLTSFKQTMLDPYDAFFYEMMKSEGIVKIITDDADFKTAIGLEIYTANNRLL